MQTKDMNILTLAYIGDAIYELHIREYLISKNIVKVADLQRESVKYVSANAQSKFLQELIDKNFFTEEELSIVYRARNHKGARHPKNTDIITYKYATGFEALIGVLYLEKNEKRIAEIMQYIIGE